MLFRIQRQLALRAHTLRTTVLRVLPKPLYNHQSRVTHSSPGETGQQPEIQLTAREKEYKNWQKRNPAKDEILRFGLEKIGYVLFAWLFGHVSKKYLDDRSETLKLASTVGNQANENSHKLEKMRAFMSQPLLYLTTRLTENDRKEYENNQTELTQSINQLNQYLSKLKLDSTFNSFLLRNKIGALEEQLSNQITQLEIARVFNETIWLQKNRQYIAALDKCKKIIDELKPLQQKPDQKTLFNLPHILAAAYNAEAKLHACLAFFSDAEDAKKSHRNDSLAAYDNAIEALKHTSENLSELATILSSKGYLLVDCNDPKQGLTSYEQANALKPNDEHIICGIAAAKHAIEKKHAKDTQSALDASKLNEAYQYFNRSIQLKTGKVPNIFVSRGKLLQDMGNTDAALKDFDSALEEDKDHSDANLQKSFLLLKQAKPDCALAKKHFDQGILPLIGNRPSEIAKQKADYIQQLPECCKAYKP